MFSLVSDTVSVLLGPRGVSLGWGGVGITRHHLTSGQTFLCLSFKSTGATSAQVRAAARLGIREAVPTSEASLSGHNAGHVQWTSHIVQPHNAKIPSLRLLEVDTDSPIISIHSDVIGKFREIVH